MVRAAKRRFNKNQLGGVRIFEAQLLGIWGLQIITHLVGEMDQLCVPERGRV
ncbi:MAG: hypothetical protein RL518_1269 [Pseudomonadota bacterium]